MASRSRTREFIAQRERLRGNRRSHKAIELKDMKVDRSLLKQPGMSDDDASSCENACSITVPPLWVAVVDELNRDMGSIRTKLSELTQDHGRHLLPGFNDEDDKEDRIQRMTVELTQLFKQCEKRMKQLSAENKQADPESSDAMVRKNILATSATQLQELHFQFRRKQKNYLNKLQGQKAGDDVAIDIGDVSAASITAEAERILDPRFDHEQMQVLDNNERQIAERNAAVEQIMTSVVELQEIFKEIHVLVIDQGTVLDRIDYNIEQASEKISGAVGELVKANEYQKNSKVMLCIYLLLVLCCAMAVVLVAKKSLQARHGGD